MSYTRDGVGSPTVAEWTNGSSWTDYYGYDAMNRLTNYSRGTTPPAAVWSYDWVGNRDPSSFVYDAQTDQLLQPPPGTNRQYDGAGNMTQKGTVSYMYNAQNLLAALSTMRWNTWDASERRLGLNLGMGGTAFTFVYDPTAGIPAVIQEFSSGGRNTVYVREPDGSLVARFTPGESPVVDHYYFDGLGSTVMMTEGLSTVTDRYDYDAWGNPDHLYGSTADNPYQYVGQLGYYNHWMDSSLSDLLHLGVRFYEPGVGRFGQVDPAREGMNWYAYVDSNPTKYVDPYGLALSDTQCSTIRRILDYEKAHGTWRAACHFSNTWGTERMGREFDNGSTDTAAGVIDLDWWTDLVCVDGPMISCAEGVCLYLLGKSIWNDIRMLVGFDPAKLAIPFEDPKERAALKAICNGYKSFAKLFPPEFMERNCSKNRRPVTPVRPRRR